MTVSLLTVKRTEMGETAFKRNNLSPLTTCISMDVTKSIPLERIDDRQGRLKIDTKSLFLLYHSGLRSFLLTHCQSRPCLSQVWCCKVELMQREEWKRYKSLLCLVLMIKCRL